MKTKTDAARFPGKRVDWILAQPIDGVAKLVLVALCQHFNVSRCDAFPGSKRLAALTSYSPLTVRRALRRLEAAGLVSGRRRVGRSTVFQVHVGTEAKEPKSYLRLVEPQQQPEGTTEPSRRGRRREKRLDHYRRAWQRGDSVPGWAAEVLREEDTATESAREEYITAKRRSGGGAA